MAKAAKLGCLLGLELAHLILIYIFMHQLCVFHGVLHCLNHSFRKLHWPDTYSESTVLFILFGLRFFFKFFMSFGTGLGSNVTFPDTPLLLNTFFLFTLFFIFWISLTKINHITWSVLGCLEFLPMSLHPKTLQLSLRQFLEQKHNIYTFYAKFHTQKTWVLDSLVILVLLL